MDCDLRTTDARAASPHASHKNPRRSGQTFVQKTFVRKQTTRVNVLGRCITPSSTFLSTKRVDKRKKSQHSSTSSFSLITTLGSLNHAVRNSFLTKCFSEINVIVHFVYRKSPARRANICLIATHVAWQRQKRSRMDQHRLVSQLRRDATTNTTTRTRTVTAWSRVELVTIASREVGLCRNSKIRIPPKKVPTTPFLPLCTPCFQHRFFCCDSPMRLFDHLLQYLF